MSKKKQGILLIDVAIAMAIFLILSISIFSFLRAGNKYYYGAKDSMRNSALIEAVRKELKYNLDLSKCKEKIYINKNNLNMDALKENKINSIISLDYDGELPYIEINISKVDFYEIKYLWNNGKDQIKGEVYRKE